MSAEHNAESVPHRIIAVTGVVGGRRPVRFFHHFIKEQGQIWLEPDQVLVNVEYDGTGWHLDVAEMGPEQSDGST